MEIENLLNILLNSALLIESICVPILSYLIHQYSSSRRMKLKIWKFYSRVTWLMLVTIMLSALEAFAIMVYMAGFWQIDKLILKYFTTGIILILISLLPLIMLYLWIEERRRHIKIVGNGANVLQ